MEHIFEYLKSLHIDPIIVLLVIAAGFFQNTYLKGLTLAKDTKTDSALKTLVVSFVVAAIYFILIGWPSEALADYFLSYFLATSFYEIILRPVVRSIRKQLGLLEKDEQG